MGMEAGSDTSFGLRAYSNSSNAVVVSGPVNGTFAGLYAEGNNGHAVYGDGESTGRAGISGGHTLSGGGAQNRWAFWANGDIGASGQKYFVQPHPTDPARAIAFVCLEGNESGTYFRGTTNLVAGAAELSIPEEWRMVTDDKGITVQVTPHQLATLAVVSKSRDRIVVVGTADVTFDYFVNGVRRGYRDHKAIIANEMFRPDIANIEYGWHLPPALRSLLVENGTLNPDFTPNLQTAAVLGWTLRVPTQVDVEREAKRLSATRTEVMK